MTNRLIVEGFSVSHAAILDGTTGAEAVNGDLYGVESGTLAADLGTYDNTGDDRILSTWDWFNFATLTITSGYIPFATIALLTGDTTTSSGTNPNDYYYQPLWSQQSMNVGNHPVLIRVPSKDADGNVRDLDFVLYKVKFAPINFTGPTYKDGLKVNYGGKVLMSSVDETGASLGTGNDRVGRLISRPQVIGQ